MLKSLSLTTRLAAIFTGLAALIVTGLGWVFMLAANQHFMELDQRALRDKMTLTTGILEKSRSIDDAQNRLTEALSSHHGLHILVRDEEGVVIFLTPGFTMSKDFSDASGGLPQGELKWQHGEDEIHGISQLTRAGYAPDKPTNVLVALDTKHHADFLEQLRQTIIWYTTAATVVCGILGWIAAHHGLTPLRSMKARAASVSGQKMSERMSVDSVPIEMADLARALNDMLDRLQEDFRRLSEFSSDLAHELRTPISNLLTQTQVVLSSRRDEDMYRETLASNVEEFQRLARMVSDMLFLAKTERASDLPSREIFTARSEIQALADYYEAVFDENGVSFSLQGEGEISGDRLMFRRAINNLLSNAIRYTPRGKAIKVRIFNGGGLTTIAVENDGETLDPLILPRLFDRFFRADPSRSRPEQEGAGLGLAITKAIAEAHGGSVRAQSREGKTCFLITFLSERDHAPHKAT